MKIPGAFFNGGDNHTIISPPYSELAAIYDKVMAHVDYASWSSYISSIFRYYGAQIDEILEVACGTGNLSLLLRQKGFGLTCTDICPQMLKVAVKKFKRHGFKPVFFCSSMTSLPVGKLYDSVICMYDSINYMKTCEDFRKALSEAYLAVKPGGLYIFDVCTVKNSQLFFSRRMTTDTIKNITYERTCSFDSAESIQENHFRIIKRGIEFSEKHYQRIYRLKEIREMISGTGFEELGCLDDLSFRTGTENSERIHFVLRRSK